MSRRAFAGFPIFILLLAACSSQRKLSHVDTRVPAAVRSEILVSALRDRFAKQRTLPLACPEEVRELLPALSEEKVKFPPCPVRLPMDLEAARNVLRMDETSTVEDLITSQCRSISRESNDDSLESLLQGNEPARASGGRFGRVDRPAPSEDEAKVRRDLSGDLLEVKQLNEPLDRWIRLNGEFVIPEEQMEFLDQLVNKHSCRLSDQEVDFSYRTMHSLEELVRIESESEPQRGRVARLLNGIHKVIDRKIREFFQP